jgi:hypothetical protein
VVSTKGTGTVSGPSAASIGEVVSFNNTAGTLLRQGASQITDSKTSAITSDGAGLSLLSQTGANANAIYRMTSTGAVTAYDAVRGVAIDTPGTSVTGVNGVGGYVLNNSPVGSGISNASGVALFGVGVSAVDNANSWGINTICSDSTQSLVPTTGVGRICQNEYDFINMSPNSVVIGDLMTGFALSAPLLSVAHRVTAFSEGSASPRIPWTIGIDLYPGATTTGIYLEPITAPAVATVNSQDISFGLRDSGNVSRAVSIYGNAQEHLFVTPSSTPADNNVLQTNGGINVIGHLDARTTVAPPIPSTCGSGATIAGSDVAGTVSVGTGTVTSCTVNFEIAFNNSTVHCVVTGHGGGMLGIIVSIAAESQAGFVVNANSSMGGQAFDYVCIN